MLQLDTYNVEVWGGESKTVTFTVKNYGSERFYIDKLNAFDFEDSIHTQEHSWQDVVLAGDQATIRVEIEASEKENDLKAFVELKGHFLSGKECGYTDVQEEFSVNVLTHGVQKFEPECEGFSLFTLDEKFIEGYGEIEFLAVNKSGQSAVIKLETKNLGVSENIFYVPSGTEKKFSVEVQTAEERAELIYNVKLSDCGIPSKKTIIHSTPTPHPTPQPTPTPTPGKLKEVEMNVSVESDENGFIATTSIYNPNPVPVEGLLRVDLPANWDAMGEGSAFIEPFTEILAETRIVPPQGFSGKKTGKIVFSYNGLRETETIQLEKKAQGFNVIATAFAALGSGAVLIGLIVVIVIMLALLFSGTNPQELEPWVEKNK